MATKETSKSMDIQKPGTSAPDATSKPIIVTNRALLQDPMVTDKPAQPDSEQPEKKQQVVSLVSSQKVIQPTGHKTDESKSESEEPAEPEEETAPEPTGAKVTDSMPAPGEEKAVVDAIVGTAGAADEAAKQQETVQSADDKRHQAAKALAESKKYIVPVGQATHARHNRQAVLIVVVLVAALAAYLAYYLKLVKLPF